MDTNRKMPFKTDIMCKSNSTEQYLRIHTVKDVQGLTVQKIKLNTKLKD